MIYYEWINYPLIVLFLSFPPLFLPDLLQDVLTGNRHVEPNGENLDLCGHSLYGSGRMIRPLGSLFLGGGSLFWGMLSEGSWDLWRKHPLILINFLFFSFLTKWPLGMFFLTYLLTGEIKMVKPWYLLSPSLFFLWQKDKDNHSRSLNR